MEPAGPSSGYPTTSNASSSTTTTSTANGSVVHNGNGAPPGFLQYAVSTSAGLNSQQLLDAMVSAAGRIPTIPTIPTTSVPTSNGNAPPNPLPSQVIAQSLAQHKAHELEEFYNAERARASAANMAIAASQMYAGSSTSPQKGPKLEGLPSGLVPASGIRKQKQQRQPRADVAPGSVASAVPASPSGAGAAAPPLQPIANGQPVRRPDAHATGGEIVGYLMQFNIQAAEADFSSKALESLHKKIKDRPQDMEAFMRAVETKGEVVGGCITVTRTLDGRLQVAGRKGFPHVIYTKIFRFQELHKNELKSIPQCQFGFDNKLENEEHKPDAQVCVNPYHYERVTAPSGGGSILDPLTGLFKANGIHMDDMMDFATSSSSSHIKISPDFMHARSSVLENLGLSGNPPPLGGFGYNNLDIKPIIDKGESSQDGSPKSANQLLDAISFQATLSAAGSREGLEDSKTGVKMIRERSEITDSSDGGGGDMFPYPHHYESEMSESESTKREIENITSMMLAAGVPMTTDTAIEFEHGAATQKLEDLKKAREAAEKEPLNSDDSDYAERMMERQKMNKDIEDNAQKQAVVSEELQKVLEARGEAGSPEFMTIEDDATIWTGHYIDNDGNPSYMRDRKWRGQPPNSRVTVGAIGSGTFGSKGPHLKPRQHLKNMEWSLQQLARMLEIVAREEKYDSTQYMLLCQHYAGMISKTEAAFSSDPEQRRLVDAAEKKARELLGSTSTTFQAISAWDISRLFANHIKTLAERREEEAERRRRGELAEMTTQWTFELDAELQKIIADTKGTDAEGIFSKKQIQRALSAREKIIKGEKVISDELMEVEELKSPFARALEDRKKRKRAAGLDEEMEPEDPNGPCSMAEANGEPMDSDPLLPLQPLIENALTFDDLQELFNTPSEYMKSFRDYVFGEQGQVEDVDMEEEMDESLRGVVPPREGDGQFQPFDGKERENDEPDDHGEERPPFKRNCRCPDKEREDHCFWGKHHHYLQGVSKEIVDAAFILYRYRIQRKKSEGGPGELYNFATKFNCPKVCLTRTTEIEPHSAKWKPDNYKWCAVRYCERDHHVGVLKQVEEVNYFIDAGFESGTEQRLCLSTTSHPLTRFDRQVQDVRSKIGCGVRISLKEDGSMWVRVLSRYPVFIQSAFLDREAGLVAGDAIHKIYPGTAVKAFDLIRSRQAILQMYDYQCEAAKLHNGAKKRDDLPYPLCSFNRRELRAISRVGADDMQKFTMVKIGFCKGWGPEFEYKRITETPCWVEIINNRACEFIDHCMSLREVSYAFSELDSSDYDD